MDENLNTDKTFKHTRMSMDGKVTTHNSRSNVNDNLSSTNPAVITSINSSMNNGLSSGFNGSMNNGLSNGFINPLNSGISSSINNHNIIRTNSMNGMSNTHSKGNDNKVSNNHSLGNNNSTHKGVLKGSLKNESRMLTNNLVNNVVNSVVNTLSNGTVTNNTRGGNDVDALIKGTNEPGKTGGEVVIKRKVGRPRGTTTANKVVKKEEKVSTSSSGYPGVSWNKRMCAWLAFFYDGASRRSRTFHPKHFEMDKEKARLAAVEFMKSLENNGRKKSTKNKAGRNKNKQMNNEEETNAIHNKNDIANSLSSRNPSTSNHIPMHLMSMNHRFYMQNMNRNFNLTNMSAPNERITINNVYNSLSDNSNLGNMSKSMQNQNHMYMHNNNTSAPMFGGSNSMHMLSNPNSNVNGNGCNSSNNNNSNGNNGNNMSNNNIHYLNDLMFHSNVLQPSGAGSGVTPDGTISAAGGGRGGNGNNSPTIGSANYNELSMNSNHTPSELLKLEENLGLHNKEAENIMNAFFRQNYNMNINMEKHHHYLHNTSAKNNSTSQGTMKPSVNNTTNGAGVNGTSSMNNATSAGVGSVVGVGNSVNNHVSNNSSNPMNNSMSANAHLYLPNHGVNDVFESNNESNNISNMSNMTNMSSIPSMPSMRTNNVTGSMPSSVPVNYYDYNFDIYRGSSISPHLIEIVHQLNNDLEDSRNKAGENLNENVDEVKLCMHDNVSWINQLKHSNNNLCNNLSNDHCDLCNTSNSSPEHSNNNNVIKQLEMNKRKKGTNNVLTHSNLKTEFVDSIATPGTHSAVPAPGSTTQVSKSNSNGSGNYGGTANSSNSGGGVGGGSNYIVDKSNVNTNFEMNNNNIPCNCAPNLRNQKKHYCMYYGGTNPNAPSNDSSYNFMAPWNRNNSNSSNNIINGMDIDQNNENLMDNLHLPANGGTSTNNSNRNLTESNKLVLCVPSSNNQNNALSQNANNLSINLDINPNEQSAAAYSSSSAPFSGTTNIQDIQKQMHFQNQQNNGTLPQDIHNNTLHMVKQRNNFSQKTVTNINNSTITQNSNMSAAGGGVGGGRGSEIGGSSSTSSNENLTTTSHKKRGTQDGNMKNAIPSAAGSSHSMNTQKTQNSKKNSANSNFIENNNLCSKLNSIINFEWLDSDMNLHQNGNNQSPYENDDT
ncbi:transcription factor with AP2 domain(s) [Plasmodium gonderi]|uniref:Transcription factor with AP2 domain(S) n=1 Tax=Plasmodium gonderi TaxID=77519 RepID=A0A1Y1JIS0_PLAGO|nr:transcription factor with AP2 domain(s) [Plasmodium gonderi]GAW82421.1 transcription factor with AP2 domain(s) [Plasmodium gonderi]